MLYCSARHNGDAIPGLQGEPPMAKKQITTQFKLQAPGGKATPAPPIGPALGAHGVNPGQFIQQFNEATKHLNGKIVGCLVSVYQDRTFDIEIKSPPAAVMIKDMASIEKGSGVPNKDKVGTLTMDQVYAIAEEKAKELTGKDRDANARTIAGTARSMGVVVEGMEVE